MPDLTRWDVAVIAGQLTGEHTLAVELLDYRLSGDPEAGLGAYADAGDPNLANVVRAPHRILVTACTESLVLDITRPDGQQQSIHFEIDAGKMKAIFTNEDGCDANASVLMDAQGITICGMRDSPVRAVRYGRDGMLTRG